MFNKKVLIEALKKVDAAKARTKKGKDVILDQDGQREHPGQITQIQGDTMATDGYGNIPLMVYPNNGQPPQVVQANTGEHYFPGATNFTEVPLDMAKRGGIKSKKYSKSLLATNRLYKKNPLYKKKNYKSKTYDPMAMYFADGGSKEQYYTYGKSKNQYKKIGNQWYISNDVTDFKWQPIHDPTGNRAKELNKNAKVNPNPWIQNPNTIEGKINKAMNDPQGQSARASAFYARPGEDDVDNLRHADAARRTQQAIAKATGSDFLGYLGSVGLGVGHEVGTIFTDPRPWGVVTQEAYEDIRNNNLGAEMGYFHTPNATKRLNYLSQTYQMPDGYGAVKPFPGSNWTDPYDEIEREKAQREVWNNPNPKPASLTEKFVDGGAKPGCKPVPPTAAEVQAQILNEGKGPTAEGAARVSRAAKLRADWEKRCGSNTVTDVKPEVKSEEKPKRKLGQLGPQSFKNGGIPKAQTGKIIKCPEGYTYDQKTKKCVSNYERVEYRYPEGTDIRDIHAVHDLWPVEYGKDFTHIKRPTYIKPLREKKLVYNNGAGYQSISIYPDVNYKLSVDPSKTEGYDKATNTYYVPSENTHQYKKYKEWEKAKELEKQNLATAQELINTGKFKLEDINEEEFLNVRKNYANPSYLPEDLLPYEELYKTGPKEKYENFIEGACPECSFSHGQRVFYDKDFLYKKENPALGGYESTDKSIKPIAKRIRESVDPNLVDIEKPAINYRYGVWGATGVTPQGGGTSPATALPEGTWNDSQENYKEKNKLNTLNLGSRTFAYGGDISIPELNQYEEGGFIEIELTREEIKKYIEDGHRVEDVSAPSVGNYKKGGALLTKKVTCKKCGWEWDAADGGDDVTTCHKCGGQGLVHAQAGLIKTAEGIGKGLKATSEFRNMMNALNEAGDVLPTAIPASVNIAKGLENVKPKLPAFNMQSPMSFSPTRVAASRPISPDSFSPIRFGDDYAFKGKEWYHVDPENYLPEDFKKIGLQDASDRLKSYLSKLHPYAPNTFKGMGDFRFKDFSQGSNFRRDMLAAAAGPQRQLSTEDFFTDDELIRMAHQQADYWNARDQFDIDNPGDPAKDLWESFATGNTSRDELFSLLYPNASMPNWRERFMQPYQEKLTREILGNYVPGLSNQGLISKPALKTAVDPFSKEIPLEATRVREMQDQTGYLYTADPKMVVMEMKGSLGLKLDDINNASPEQLEKWRQQIIQKTKAKDLERYKALLGNPFTAGDAYSKMTLNKYGGVPKAQAGLIKGAEKAFKTVSPFLRGASIATLGTLNSLAKNVPVMINPIHIPSLGFLAGERSMVGPFTGSPLNYIPGYGKDLAKEMKPNEAFRYFGDNLDYVKLNNNKLDSGHGPLLRKGKSTIMNDKGQWFEQGTPNASYTTVFGVRANPDAPGSNLRYMPKGNRNGVLIGDVSSSNPRIINLNDPGATVYRRMFGSERLSPVDLDNPWDWKNYGGNLQALAERYGYAAAYGAGLAAMGYPTYQETLDKYVNEPVSRFVENSKKQMEEFLKGSPVKKK